MNNVENINDPTVEKKIGQKILRMSASHMLPVYYEKYPFYDRALPRIAKRVRDIDEYLTFIDIGANIGDTVSLVTDKVRGSFLCVEGDKKYLPFLKINLGNLKSSSVIIEECFCAEDNDRSKNIKVHTEYGSARLEEGATNTVSEEVVLKSLDSIIESHPLFEKTNLLKIDTDGYEINVLKGGQRLLEKAQPIIFFEFDPELYSHHSKDPLFVFDLLCKNGYEEALIYDNFGIPLKIIRTSDKGEIKSLITEIDKNKIYYFDVLTFHCSKDRYKKILNRELFCSSLPANILADSAGLSLKGFAKRLLKVFSPRKAHE